MRILMTGGSSFTGMWFAKALASRGNHMTLPLKREESAYLGIRKDRITEIKCYGDLFFSHPFGSFPFLDLIKNSPPFDIFCHHAAEVTEYRSPQFDFIEALKKNTKNLDSVIETLQGNGCLHILITGSVFERGEGAGSDELEALSPYGLSKGLTYEAFRFFCHKKGIHFGKFVIPNPFGPFEEERFTTYLMKEWFQGREALVKTPEYVRDNIPVSLLASAYAEYVKQFFLNPKKNRFLPSYTQETVKEFALRYAAHTSKRLNKPCSLKFLKQEVFDEPRVRVNTTPLSAGQFSFDEERFFDENTLWYQKYLFQGDS